MLGCGAGTGVAAAHGRRVARKAISATKVKKLMAKLLMKETEEAKDGNAEHDRKRLDDRSDQVK
jgi:hypothetical protein